MINTKIIKRVCLLVPIIIIELLVGCEKTTTFTIYVYSGSGGTIIPSGKIEVVNGHDLVFSVIPALGYKADSISIDGTMVQLVNNNSYTLSVTGDHVVNVAFKITPLGLLVQMPWYTAHWQFRLLRETNWAKDKYPPDIDIETYTFTTLYTVTILNPNQGISGAPYELKGDSLIIGGGLRNKIVELSQTKLIVEFLSLAYSAPYVRDTANDGIVRITYQH